MPDRRPTWQDTLDEHQADTAAFDADLHDPNVPNPQLPLSNVQVYQTISITEIGLPTSTVELTAPVDLLDESFVPHAERPAVGVLLNIEQAWRMRGLAKGKLLHSLCLAPGEVTQVAMVGWQRTSSGSTSEIDSEQETSDRTADRTQQTAEVTNAVASEMQSGGSSASSFAAQASAGVGGIAGFLGATGGMSMNMGIAGTASFSTGTRDATADSRQRVRQQTAQHASNSRSRVATLVQEVHQSETEQFSSRVVANYNHMHALNIQYYEVLQVYELSAQPVHAERCIFLPMALMRFDSANVVTFVVPLVRAARAMGRTVLAQAIEHNTLTQERATRRIEQTERSLHDLELRMVPEQEALDAIDARVAALTKQLSTLMATKDTLELSRAEVAARVATAEHDFGWWNFLNGQGPDGRRVVGTEGTFALLNIGAIQARLQAARTDQQDITTRLAQLDVDLPPLRAELDGLTQQAQPLQRDLDMKQAEIDVTRAELAGVRAAAAAEAGALLRELNEDQLAMNQALWLQMDAATVRSLVVDREHLGQPIADTIDPTPVALIGNYLGYRWGFPDTDAGRAAADAFRIRYVEEHRSPALDTHVLPTGGLFAESVLGRSIAAEELDLTRFWHWDDDTIPLLPTAIGTLQAAARAQRPDAAPGVLGASAAQLGVLPGAPAGPLHALTGVMGASLFRDMSGASVIGGLLSAAQKVSGEGAKHAQELAHQNISQFLDHAEKLLPEVTKAITSGDIDPSTLGALGNAIGKGGSFDAEGLVGLASKIGILL